MITLKEWMEIVNYRVTEGSDFTWSCYGDNAYCLDSWDGDQNGSSFTIIFDTKTQEVYEVQAHDYRNGRAYRMINSNYVSAYKHDADVRDSDSKEAWEGVNYVDLEEDDDFFQKALAIFNNEEYDTRVSVPLDLDDETLFSLMKMAHERDVTLNEFVEDLLRKAIEELKV